MIGKLTPPIPDALFLGLKRLHCRKIEVSKQLSKHPGSWLWLFSLRLALRDNFGWDAQEEGKAKEQ